MTLRLALLLTCLILLAIIGLVCHYKYRKDHPQDRSRGKTDPSDKRSALEGDINAPFLGESMVPDVADQAQNILDTPGAVIEPDNTEPEFLFSTDSDEDDGEAAGKLAQELLASSMSGDLDLDHTAMLVNIRQPARRIKAVTGARLAGLPGHAQCQVLTRGDEQFRELQSVSNKNSVIHLKIGFSLFEQHQPVDLDMVEKFETRAALVARDLGCHHQFALPAEQAVAAAGNLDEFVRDIDLIVILYVLSQPEEPFPGKAIQNAVSAAELEFGEPGFFHYSARDGENKGLKVFSLANMYKPGTFDIKAMKKFKTTGMCAFMVPALVPDPVTGFRQMCVCSKTVSDHLHGVLTTDQRELLDQDNFTAISRQIAEFRTRLGERGITCGSDAAERLFG